MKKFRILSLVLICVLCAMLTGCLGTVTTTEINEDGSGSFTVNMGYTKEGLELINSMAAEGETTIDINTLTPFEYNGIIYYGQSSELVSFGSCEEFNNKLVETVNSMDNMSMNEDACTLTKLSDGSFTLKFGGEVDLGSQSTDSTDSTPEEQQAIDEMMKSFVMAFEFKFPYPVMQTSTEKVDGVTINGDKLSLELITISTCFAEKGKTEGYVEFLSKDSAGPVIGNPGQEQHNIADSCPFDDVHYTDWFYAAVKKMADIGMVAGVGNGKFNPDGEMTYAEFATIVARANKVESGSIDGYWAGKAVEYARDMDFIKDLGAIIPANYDVPVHREVAVAGVYRMSREFIQNTDTSITELNIPDYDSIDEAYRNEILLAYQAGLSQGSDEKGTFNPKSTLTRAELCQLLTNAGFTLH